MRIGTVHIDLGEDIEFCAFATSKGFDLGVRARLLAAKLVARERGNGESMETGKWARRSGENAFELKLVLTSAFYPFDHGCLV